ncbi:hypothetical protein [Streptomyces erythrochromogenes]
MFQTLLGLAAGLPLIVDASGVPQSAAGVAVALAVAGAVTRVMALPVVQRLLPRWLYEPERPPVEPESDRSSPLRAVE